MTSFAGGFAFRPSYSHEGVSGSHGSGDAAAARSEAREASREVERLLMITEALWTMLKEQHGYTDEDLIKRIAEIDARDGKLDGRVTPEPGELPTCSQCGRPVGRGRAACLYCATPIVRDPFVR